MKISGTDTHSDETVNVVRYSLFVEKNEVEEIELIDSNFYKRKRASSKIGNFLFFCTSENWGKFFVTVPMSSINRSIVQP